MARRPLAGNSARGRGRRIVAVGRTARGLSIPAPVEGWDSLSPIASMPEKRAVRLVNVFPQPGYVEVRKGHKLHNTLSPVVLPVESLMAYHALASSNDKLFAACGTAVYDVTVTTTATISAAVSGLANARWQHINFSTAGGNFLWMCNGADTPIYYDGAAWNTATITGSLTPSTIVNVAAYSERLWLVLADQISPYFLPTDSIQGAATLFDLSGVFTKGGALMGIGTWSRDGGQGPDDYVAFVTTKGEVAIYSGDPQRNMEIAGVYEMGAPIGRRSISKVGSDLAIVCIDGVVPLSRAISEDRSTILKTTITALIQPTMNQSARDYGDRFGWELITYPRGTRAILNVPVTENTEQVQYVMNTITGAWCEFRKENANCWAIFQERLFYGGNEGQIIEADCQGFDYDAAIEFDMFTAFSYAGVRGALKSFDWCRAQIQTDGQASVGLALNIDFGDGAEVAGLTFPSDPLALWDVATWDDGVWPETTSVVADWTKTEGQGYAASIRMQGSVQLPPGGDASQDVVFRVNGWDMLVRDGAFIG